MDSAFTPEFEQTLGRLNQQKTVPTQQVDSTQVPDQTAPMETGPDPGALSTNNSNLPGRVNVWNSYGKAQNIPIESLPAALERNYRLMTPAEVVKQKAQQDFSSGVGNQILAAGAGLLRGPSFGLSDQFLTHSGAVNPETLDALQKAYPITSFGTELVGIGSTLKKGAQAVGKSVGLAELASLSPPGIAHEIGQGVQAGAAALLPAGETMGASILNRVGSLAAGSAAEGAFYGLGHLISENALGNADLNAENLVYSTGVSAVLSGALGGAMGIPIGWANAQREGLPWFRAKPGKGPATPSEMAPINPMMDENGQGLIPFEAAAARERLLKRGITSPANNAEEVIAAGENLGIPIFESQLTSDQKIRTMQAQLFESPTPPGVRLKQRLHEAFQNMSKRLERVFADPLVDANGEPLSPNEMGGRLLTELQEGIRKRSEPFRKLYDSIENAYQEVPLTDVAAKQLGSPFKSAAVDLKEVAKNIVNLETSGFKSPFARWVKGVADDLANVKTLQQLREYTTQVRTSALGEFGNIKQDLGDFNVRSVLGKLDDLEERALLRFAQRNARTANDLQLVEAFKQFKDQTDLKYSEFRKFLETLGAKSGKNRVAGARNLERHLENMTAEKLTKKLIDKNDIEFLEFFQKEFPDQFREIGRYIKTNIRQSHNGELQITPMLKKYEALPKEVKKMIFGDSEMTSLEAMKTWKEALPAHPNPSKSGIFKDWQEYISDAYKNPTAFALKNIADMAKVRKIEKEVPGFRIEDTEQTIVMKGLSFIEKSWNKTQKTMETGINKIFDSKDTYARAGAGFSSSKLSQKQREEEYDDIHALLTKYQTNPESLMEALDNATYPLFPIAPKTVNGINKTLINTLKLLMQKIPAPEQRMRDLKHGKPSASALYDFQNVLDTIKNPFVALEQVQYGTLIPDTIETLQAVYPQMYDDMKIKIMDKYFDLKSKDEELPRRTLVMLSEFMGSDLDESLEPQNILQSQNIMAQINLEKNQQQNPQGTTPIKGNKSAIGKMKAPNRAMTGAQASSNREVT